MSKGFLKHHVFFSEKGVLLLMAEILHHLGCINLVNNEINYLVASNHLKNMLVIFDHFPKVRGEN